MGSTRQRIKSNPIQNQKMTQFLREYKDNGFVVARGILDPKQVHDVVASIDKTLNDQLHALSCKVPVANTFEGLKTLHDTDIKRYTKVVAALWRKESVFALMHDPKITGFLRDNFGWDDLFLPGGQVVLIMAEELRIPGGYFGLVPHQDFPSVQGSLNGVVVWIPLTDVDKDNYPLEVVRYSHKLGLAPMIDHGESTREVPKDWFQGLHFEPVEVNVGDVIFMSMFTIHQTSINGTKGRCRIAASTRFDNANEPTFVDRAYPTAYTRSVHRDQYVQDFPSQELVARTFD